MSAIIPIPLNLDFSSELRPQFWRDLSPASRTALRRAHNPQNRVRLTGWLPGNKKITPAALTRHGALNRSTDAVPVTRWILHPSIARLATTSRAPYSVAAA